jgi:predicted transcriptional regulator
VTPDTTIGEAWLVMAALNVRHLIITNGQGVIVGLVSDTDFTTQSGVVSYPDVMKSSSGRPEAWR